MLAEQGFSVTTHAKCIIAGEHTVLRGHPALVFPVNTHLFQLDYQPASNKPACADFDAPYGENLLIFLWKMLAISLQMLNKDLGDIQGQFFLKNTIPMGCGLGFSAALCTAIAQWLIWQGWLDKQDLFNFARTLEDNFHGKSSGVDIAGALTNMGVLYSTEHGIENITVNWKPLLYLSSSEHYCSTEKCIRQVEKLHAENKYLAELLDNEMADSVLLAKQALILDADQGFSYLAEAINKANSCFKKWGLITPLLTEHINSLYSAGAVAVKPTGSGGGGYVLSLWRTPPLDTPFIKHLKPLFYN